MHAAFPGGVRTGPHRLRRPIAKASVLLLGLALGVGARTATAQPRAEPRAEHYVDDSGQQVDHARVYHDWFGGQRYKPRYLRAAGENAGLLLFELFLYWYEPHSSVVDWQFPDISTKLTSNEAFRFDDNLTRTNFMLHPTAGGMHYLLTRTNGFGVLPSFAAAAGSSAIYEFVLEWREVVSINDLIVTPLGGLASGEFMHQLGNYLNSEQPQIRTTPYGTPGSVARGGARYSLGLPRALHQALDEPEHPPPIARDNLGLSSAYAHEFRVRMAQQSLFGEDGKLGDVFALRSELEIAAMPGFLKRGRFHRWFTSGNFVSFQLRLANGDSGYATEFLFDSHLFGHYGQNLRSPTHGTANEFAIASKLRYVDRRELGNRQHFGIVHLPHPTETVWVGLGDLRLEFGARISPDFASIRSTAFEKYEARFSDFGTESSLQLHGYAHAFGVSGDVFASLDAGAVEVGGKAMHGRYDSIDVLGREQESITRRTHSEETMTELSAFVSFEPEATPLSSRLELAEVRHSSHLDSPFGPFQSSAVVRRVSVELGLVF